VNDYAPLFFKQVNALLRFFAGRFDYFVCLEKANWSFKSKER
jgi:hypothetical protein